MSSREPCARYRMPSPCAPAFPMAASTARAFRREVNGPYVERSSRRALASGLLVSERAASECSNPMKRNAFSLKTMSLQGLTSPGMTCMNSMFTSRAPCARAMAWTDPTASAPVKRRANSPPKPPQARTTAPHARKKAFREAWSKRTAPCPASARSSSSHCSSTRTCAASSARFKARSLGSRRMPRHRRFFRSKQGIYSRSPDRAGCFSAHPSDSRRARAGWIPCTSVRTSVGSAMLQPTSSMACSRLFSSDSSTGPIMPSPHVPGKKLDPEHRGPSEATVTRASASAASSAAESPAMPDPTTSTSQ